MEGDPELNIGIKKSDTAKKSLKKTTIDKKEVQQFNQISGQWWDESGALKPLHQINPARLQYIKEQLCQYFALDAGAAAPLKKLRIADIGCGGGLITEPLSKLGAKITGIDAGEENIKAASHHAKKQKLEIDYRVTTAEDLAETKEKFDAVIALEIIEHIANLDLFISSCCKLLKPNGMLIFSTLNRTPKSFMLGIVAAEYILRWLPAGTHDWEKFVKPSEIAKPLQQNGLKITDISGITYHPLKQEWSLSDDDVGVNYLLTAVQPMK